MSHNDGCISDVPTRIATALFAALHHQQSGDHIRVMACALDAYRAAREIGDVEAGRASILMFRDAHGRLSAKSLAAPAPID